MPVHKIAEYSPQKREVGALLEAVGFSPLRCRGNAQLAFARRWLTACVLGALLLGLAACGGTAAPSPVASAGAAQVAASSQLLADAGQSAIPQPGEIAPDFSYTLADGSTRTLAGLRGKQVLVNFWATWCGPCRMEMPDLQRALAEHPNLVVLGVNKLETPEQIAAFAGELKVGFLLIANPSGDIPERYAAQLLPTSYFINSDGTIALRKTGVMDYQFMANHLAELK